MRDRLTNLANRISSLETTLKNVDLSFRVTKGPTIRYGGWFLSRNPTLYQALADTNFAVINNTLPLEVSDSVKAIDENQIKQLVIAMFAYFNIPADKVTSTVQLIIHTLRNLSGYAYPYAYPYGYGYAPYLYGFGPRHHHNHDHDPEPEPTEDPLPMDMTMESAPAPINGGNGGAAPAPAPSGNGGGPGNGGSGGTGGGGGGNGAAS